MNDISVLYTSCALPRVRYDMCIHVHDDESTISEFDKRTVKTHEDAMRTYRMPAPHPEMEGIKYGEELLVFNPEDEDDEDEDDGDIIVRT